MTALTAEQIEVLKGLDAAFGSQPSLAATGRKLADQFRTQLPDLDDLTLGRVLLEVGARLANAVMEIDRSRGAEATEVCVAISAMASAYACAAIALTEIHWKDMPS
ncbi:hypothetical protein E1264_17780 [Actinomadura sp. KC216]|uniref:hypothetical protein n=1 Tax=Actinomadura sp. KC216 TaxID=2530370 RepID=UPI0010535B94|nr:hypothetical protein [Actinomadura sp. KC216]TDB86449.1 hypothetical protein E1264_17780 [Actinomadura sp. KC216]